MSLEDAVRTELLGMRKHTDAVTVGALARTEAIRRVLGGGDPRVAYNALKHILLDKVDDLAIAAASYSLGYASEAPTHLERLSDFGRDYAYDQRQARRYSDRGVTTLARHIASEWTLEASPVLRVSIIRWDTEGVELVVTTERLRFIEMQEPRVETLANEDHRQILNAAWHVSGQDSNLVLATAHFSVQFYEEMVKTVSVLWPGELWPKFTAHYINAGSALDWSVASLAARLSLSIDQ